MAGPSVREKKIKDYVPQQRNANRGTERGQAMLEHSLRTYGLGRSIVVDKRRETIGGAKTLQKAAELGFENVVEVDADGKTLVVVRRTDLDLETDPAARGLALADNRVAEADLQWDADVLIAELGQMKESERKALWTDDELQVLSDALKVGGEQSEVDAEPQIDRAQELQKQWQTAPGQLWGLGRKGYSCPKCKRWHYVDK